MSRLRVLCFSVPIDGFAAGPEQSMRPLGYRCVERAATDKATHVVLGKA